MRQALKRTRAAGWRASLLLATWLPAAAAQAAAPLRKSDLVRLLSNPLIQRREIAEVVRRSCLAFQPTERDWSDLRRLGADADVLSSVGTCAVHGARRTAAPTAPAPPVPPSLTAPASLVAAFLTPRVAVTAGTSAAVPILVKHADGTQARGVTLALRTTPGTADGPPAEVQAVTDDSGSSAFDIPAVRRPGRYRFELVAGSGAVLPGRPVVELLVSPGPPAAAEVRPSRFDVGSPGDTALGLLVTVRDALGNGVPREPIVLRPDRPGMGIPADTQATDSLGHVSFVVPRAVLWRPGKLEVRARGALLAAVDAAPAPPPSLHTYAERAPQPPPQPEFIGRVVQRGLARMLLADALTVQVHTASGVPIAGKVVKFQAVNAVLDRDSAVTDSVGRVRLQVRLGMKAGIALVTAIVDSVRCQDTLAVEPGAAVELWLERDEQRVDGGRILVELGVPFSLTLRARDRYGNTAPAASLAGRLQDLRSSFNSRPGRLLDLLAVQLQGPVIVSTFKPVRLGTMDLMIDVGLTSSVAVHVVPRSD